MTESASMPGIGAASEQDGLDDLVPRHASQIAFDWIPAETVQKVKGLVLDTFGAAMAAVEAEGSRELSGAACSWQGAPQARIWATGTWVPAHTAVLVNATLARALEIDEVHEKALLHSAASMVTIALAEAERLPRVSGRDFLTAVTMGIDLAARLSMAPVLDTVGANHKKLVFCFSYQMGALVGAMVSGKLYSLSPDDMRNVLGVAYSQCAGNQQGLAEGSLTARVQQGLSCQAGVISRELAMAGVSGTRHSLEGRFGFYNAFYGGAYNPEVVRNDLGHRYEADNVSYKQFPCCKFTHTAIAAALKARDARHFLPQHIERVVAHVNNHEYFEMVCKPTEPALRREELAGDRGWVRAQFSLPYVVSLALVKGMVALTDFTEAGRCDPVVLAVMDTVETVMDDGDGASGRVLPTPGHIDVYLKGETAPVSATAEYAPGHPRSPLDFGQVAEKFLGVTEFVAGYFPKTLRLDLISAVERLDEFADVREIVDLLIPPERR